MGSGVGYCWSGQYGGGFRLGIQRLRDSWHWSINEILSSINDFHASINEIYDSINEFAASINELHSSINELHFRRDPKKGLTWFVPSPGWVSGCFLLAHSR
ncbi:hypothetical protein [Rossellomorea vietnamensis]|uniref:hypothetical protein n=1 Tax=Rossellomorea vietnamensis TaxID=218284 RepID=UPI003CF6003C